MADTLDEFNNATLKGSREPRIETKIESPPQSPPSVGEKEKIRLIFKQFDVLPWVTNFLLIVAGIAVLVVLYKVAIQPTDTVEKVVYKTKKSIQYKTKDSPWLKNQLKKAQKELAQARALIAQANKKCDLNKHAIETFINSTDKGVIEITTY